MLLLTPEMKKGYTLVEILVAITIITIVFFVGYLGFRDFSRRTALADAAKLIIGDLRLAQGQALSGKKIMTSSNCTGVNTLNDVQFKVVSSNSYSTSVDCTGGSIVIKNVTMPSGITLSFPTPNPITFLPIGNGTNINSGSNAVITLTQSGTGNTATVTISSGGEVQ